jgi:phospholipid-binding lipoprotein MlaA
LKAANYPYTLVLLLAFFMSACTTVPTERRVASDPWEPLNRTIFSVNVAADNVSTKPIAKGYRKVIPGPIRKGVSNFFRNLTTPQSAINNFLQGKPARGLSEVGRFLFNSTLGVGGLVDIATIGGMDEYPEDFGQTLAVWGVPDGPYVMVPILGPQTLRDAVMLPIDIAVDPLFHYEKGSLRQNLYILRLIDLRYRVLPADKLLEESKDPYLTLRESFLQNREYEIYDGEPPVDDDFFDEFMDDE